jgi:subtilase family serine protease
LTTRLTTRTVLGRSALFLTIVGLAACSTGTQQNIVPVSAPAATQLSAHRAPQSARAFAADCSATTGDALCSNIELAGTTIFGPTTPAANVPGFHPADLQAAYKFPSAAAGRGQTIAIVIAASDPNAEADLAVYRSTFGLKPCSVSSGCLAILTTPSYTVAPDKDWAREASTGLDMASAICPNCKLMLYQTPNTKDHLAQGISAAAAAGATVISNSFTLNEHSSMATWQFPSVPVIAAAGDSGFGFVDWPAAATNVIAVGATTLTRASTTARGWTESVWSGTSSGCSAVATKPAWQTNTGCTGRMTADIAAVGDPNTPVGIYDSYQDNGWLQVGGTSVSAPIIAGAYGLAANGATLTGAASIYAHADALFAVTTGSNGTCSVAVMCNAGPGYDGPTGMGTPNGIGAL